MTFTIRTALLRYAFAFTPVLLYQPPELGAIVRVDLARRRIEARLAHPEDLVRGWWNSGLGPEPHPELAATRGNPHHELLLNLPHAQPEQAEAWLTGALAPLAERIRSGAQWKHDLDLHDEEAASALEGFDESAQQGLGELVRAQNRIWQEGFDTHAVVPPEWKAFTWSHARVNDGGLPDRFTVDGVHFDLDTGAGIWQWWAGEPADLATHLVETSTSWSLRRPQRNQDLAVLVWDHPELYMNPAAIEDGEVPGPVATARAYPAASR